MKFIVEEQKNAKNIFWLGVVSYTIMLLMAVVFYKERTIFADTAYRLFDMLQSGNFAIQANRFGSYFSQSFLYFSGKMGLPLHWVMINYSAGFVLMNALVFFACLKWFKQPNLALLILLFNVFMVAETFYWIQSELVEGIAFAIFYFGMLLHFASLPFHLLRFLLLLATIITLVFFHPLLIIVFFFGSFFLFLSTTDRQKRLYLMAAIPFALGILVVKAKYFKAEYDSMAGDKWKNLIEFFPNYFDLESNAFFLEFVLKDYYLLPFLLVAVLVYYIRKKAYLKLFLVSSFFFGHLLMINVSYPNSMHQFHIESYYLPLSLFLLLPLIVDILPNYSQKQAFVVLGLILCIRLIHIGFQHQRYTMALDWKRNLIEQTQNLEHKKLIIDQKHVPMDKLKLVWGSPYEFWLLSALEYEEHRSIAIYGYYDRITKYNKHLYKDVFIADWTAKPYAELPDNYFQFKDTSQYVPYIPK